MALRDGFHREVDYMRMSVTDRCNLRCIYCMPEKGVRRIKFKHILSYEEMVRIVSSASALGLRRVRLTGGEPLSRKNISSLVRSLSSVAGIEEVGLTTNGVLLEKLAPELRDAGLARINVSVDSLDPRKYSEITGGGDIDSIFRGIDAAERAGIAPIKINMVPIRGINDSEIADFARLTLDRAFDVRFIEFMPIGNRALWSRDKYVPEAEIRRAVEAVAPLVEARRAGGGPARYYRLEGALGTVGFISALSNHFCSTCNRLRVTSDGRIRPCLFSETEIDLMPALRSGAPDDEIKRLIRLAVEVKPQGHEIDRDPSRALRPMSSIGG